MTAVEKIKIQIYELELKLKEIQDECSHPKAAVISTNKSDTGNYYSGDDSYWVEHDCTLCDKRWTTSK